MTERCLAHRQRSYPIEGLLFFNMSIGHMPRQLIQTYILRVLREISWKLAGVRKSNSPHPTYARKSNNHFSGCCLPGIVRR